MKKLIMLAMALGLLVSGCSMNTNPPDYIKKFTVYQEGDGLVIYFILADKSGQVTTYDGEATMEIKTIPTDWNEIKEAYEKHARNLGIGSGEYLNEYGKSEALRKAERVVFSKKYAIKKENFVKTKIGRGAFEQDEILFSFGRIPYSSLGYTKGKGRVELFYIAKADEDVSGRGFTAKETFYF